MTRKDYRIIAKAINDVVTTCYSEEEKELLQEVASSIALKLWEDNDKFNADRFMEACGLEIA